MNLIFIDGNIGAGKTTLINNMKEDNLYENAIYLCEDVENWRYLNKFYKSPKEYAYEFQTEIIYSKLAQINNNLNFNNNKYMFVERSFKTILLFSINNLFYGYINTKQFFNLLEIINQIENELTLKFKNINYIYLNISPVVCLKRILERNRVCEKYLSIDYLKNIDRLHNIFYNHINNNNDIIINIINKYKEKYFNQS